jgi:hypothetical protein
LGLSPFPKIITREIGSNTFFLGRSNTLFRHYRPAQIVNDVIIKASSDLEVVFKQKATDFVDERGQIFSRVTTTIRKKQ